VEAAGIVAGLADPGDWDPGGVLAVAAAEDVVFPAGTEDGARAGWTIVPVAGRAPVPGGGGPIR
jgi:hypothetical protein